MASGCSSTPCSMHTLRWRRTARLHAHTQASVTAPPEDVHTRMPVGATRGRQQQVAVLRRPALPALHACGCLQGACGAQPAGRGHIRSQGPAQRPEEEQGTKAAAE